MSEQELREIVSPYTLERLDPYGHDDRIGWDTYLVLVRSKSGQVYPAGYTNGRFMSDLIRTTVSDSEDVMREGE